RTHAHSDYMRWAKLSSAAKYNLTGSGMASYPLAKLGISDAQLEINGPNCASEIPNFASGYEAIPLPVRLYFAAEDNLTGSGMASYPLAKLGISDAQLEINGPNSYGYAPLVDTIGQRFGVPRE